jgi:chromosome condensin MukBEF MukE localization factor
METEMSSNLKRQSNQATFRRLKPVIDERYPAGRFVSIDDGDVIADAGDFQSLVDRIQECGKEPENVLIVQAGVNYPEETVIF